MKVPKSFLIYGLMLMTASRSLNAEADDAKGRFERLVLLQLNRVRTDPQAYADYLESRRPLYQRNGMLIRTRDMIIRTKEGVAALNEAIRALRAAPPAVALAGSEPLAKSARDFAAEQAKTGAMGHYGRGGSTPFSRMARYGAWRDTAGENIMYGSDTPENVVFDLIVDDGQPQRGHRANILNPSYRVVGIGSDNHPKFRTVCIMDFAGAFDPK